MGNTRPCEMASDGQGWWDRLASVGDRQGGMRDGPVRCGMGKQGVGQARRVRRQARLEMGMAVCETGKARPLGWQVIDDGPGKVRDRPAR
jgi:hypothetical protein